MLTTGGLVTSPVLYLLDNRGEEYRLQHSGYIEIRWNACDNRAGDLTVILDEARQESLRRVTTNAGSINRLWFGVLEPLTADSIFSEPVWWIAGYDCPAWLLNPVQFCSSR